MLNIYDYDPNKAIEYAHKWAFSRNPDYLNFDNLGGDCTNFVSQCIFAGSEIMNYSPITGWYYNTAYDRTASWTGVEYLANFLLGNKGKGAFAKLVDLNEAQVGDIIQLGDNTGHFYHTPIICDKIGTKIFVAAHTYDVWNYPLDNYSFSQLRCLHIEGVRK